MHSSDATYVTVHGRDAIERATSGSRRRDGRPPRLDAALERARPGRGARADGGRAPGALPDAVGNAVRDGLREEAAPISRQLAEVRGLSNQMIRRLERLESDLLAERNARVDDLALLVDLITAGGGRSNERLDRIERALDAARRGRLPHRGPPTPALGPTRAGSAGRISSNRSPRPTLDSSSIRPPSAVESSRAIVSPSPVPPPSRDERPEEPLLLVLARCPGPVSSTATWTVPFVWPSSSWIRPPSGVARKAFESRLPTIWSTRSPSETITGLALTSTR